MILLSTTLRTAVTTPLLRKGHLSASAGSINDAGAQGRGPERVPGGGRYPHDWLQLKGACSCDV